MLLYRPLIEVDLDGSYSSFQLRDCKFNVGNGCFDDEGKGIGLGLAEFSNQRRLDTRKCIATLRYANRVLHDGSQVQFGQIFKLHGLTQNDDWIWRYGPISKDFIDGRVYAIDVIALIRFLCEAVPNPLVWHAKFKFRNFIRLRLVITLGILLCEAVFNLFIG